MAENFNRSDMEINMDDTAAEKEMEVNCIKQLDMTTDIAMGKAIADYMGKSKVDAKSFMKSSDPEIAQIMHITHYKKDVAVCKELRNKLRYMVEKNCTSMQEKIQLRHEVFNYIAKEKQRSGLHKIVTLNRRRGQLKKLWSGRGLPIDKKSFQSADNDVFDMSSLNESLLFELDGNDIYIKKKAKKLAKEYLSFKEQKKQSFRKSEILRILASNAPEQNKNNSSKPHQSKSLTRMVKKVYGDVENIDIFSFRPVMNLNTNVESKRVGCPELQGLNTSHKGETEDFCEKSKLEIEPLQNEKMTYKFGQEVVILLKSPCTKTDETQIYKQKDKNENGCNPNTANNLQNSASFLSEKKCVDERHRKLSLLKQQLHDSCSLSHQLSELKIANSKNVNTLRNPSHLLFKEERYYDECFKRLSAIREQMRDHIARCRQLIRLQMANSKRGDLSEVMKQCEILEASINQNKNEQDVVHMANRRREVLKRLREKHRRYQQQEEQTLKKN